MNLFRLKTGLLPLKTFVAYLLVSFVLLLTPASWTGPVRRAVLFPFTLAQHGFLNALRGVEGASSKLNRLWRAENEAQRYRDEIAALKARLAEETSRRTTAESRLAQIAHLPVEAQVRGVFAAVIAYNPSPDRRIAVLNKGRRSGVAPGSAVLWNGVIVGRVESTDPGTCRAVLLGDRQCRVAVRCARSGVRGILEGIGGGLCVVKYVDLAADVKPGDLFVAAGVDNVFPADQLVGECTRVSTRARDLFKWVEVQPAFDLPQLDEVVILVSEEEEGRD